MYSFYMLIEKSAELRAIKFAVEKSHGKDAIDFFVRIKDMVGAVLAIKSEQMIMDNVHIQTSELAQIMSAVYENKMIQKMHLMTAVQSRCDQSGICSGDFAAVLLVDFVKSREKDDHNQTRVKEKLAIAKASSTNSKAMNQTKQKFSLDYDGETGEDKNQ